MELKDYNKESMAKVSGRALPISTKQAVVVCNFIRHKNAQKAKELLNDVIKKKIAVPFTRFNKGLGHKKGIGSGRYPIKTSQEIVDLLESAEANAQFKGLNTSNLVISYIRVDGASRPWHYGRQRRRRMKRCNVEIIVSEKESVKKKEKAGVPKEKKAEAPKKLSNESEKLLKEGFRSEASKEGLEKDSQKKEKAEKKEEVKKENKEVSVKK